MKKLLASALTLIMVLSMFGAITVSAATIYDYENGGVDGIYGAWVAGVATNVAPSETISIGGGLQNETNPTSYVHLVSSTATREPYVSSGLGNRVWADYTVETKIRLSDGVVRFCARDCAVVNEGANGSYDYSKTLVLAPNAKVITCTNTTEGNAIDVEQDYVTYANVWYDVIVDTHYNDNLPTYDVYIRKTGEAKYHKIAEGLQYPILPDNGKGTFGGSGLACMNSMFMPNGTVCDLDDVKIYTGGMTEAVPVYAEGEADRDFSEGGKTIIYNDFSQFVGDQTTNSGSGWPMLGTEVVTSQRIENRSDVGNYLITYRHLGGYGEFCASGASYTSEGETPVITNDFVFKSRVMVNNTDVKVSFAPKTLYDGNSTAWYNVIDSWGQAVYNVMEITAGGYVKVGNSTSYFETPNNEWVDILIDTKYNNGAPTYDAYIKSIDSNEYAKIGDDVAYPAGDYSQGIKLTNFFYTNWHGAPDNYAGFGIAELDVFYPDADYEVAVAEHRRISLTVGENGSVSVFGKKISDNTVSAVVAEGTEVTLGFEPAEGYKVDSVIVNGAPVVISGNSYTAKVTGDMTVSVTFAEEAEEEAAIVENATYYAVNAEGTYALIIYSKLNNFKATAENLAKGFGIKFWAEGNDNVITLPSHASAAPEQAFAIKVQGDAITAETTYGAKAYVGDAEGEEIAISEE